MSTLSQAVLELAEQVAEANGATVIEAQLRGQGRAAVLRVVLDSDGPLEADVVEEISRKLSTRLDEADPLGGSYTLEVTTPGLDRPLRTASDFRRQRGHEIRVRYRDGEREETAQGVVVSADEESVTLDAGGAPVTVRLADLIGGKVVLPW